MASARNRRHHKELSDLVKGNTKLHREIDELETAYLMHTHYADTDNIQDSISNEAGSSRWEHGGKGKLHAYKSSSDLIDQDVTGANHSSRPSIRRIMDDELSRAQTKHKTKVESSRTRSTDHQDNKASARNHQLTTRLDLIGNEMDQNRLTDLKTKVLKKASSKMIKRDKWAVSAASNHSNENIPNLENGKKVNNSDSTKQQPTSSKTQKSRVKRNNSLTRRDSLTNDDSLVREDSLTRRDSLTRHDSLKRTDSLTRNNSFKGDDSVKRRNSVKRDDSTKRKNSLTRSDSDKTASNSQTSGTKSKSRDGEKSKMHLAKKSFIHYHEVAATSDDVSSHRSNEGQPRSRRGQHESRSIRRQSADNLDADYKLDSALETFDKSLNRLCDTTTFLSENNLNKLSNRSSHGHSRDNHVVTPIFSTQPPEPTEIYIDPSHDVVRITSGYTAHDDPSDVEHARVLLQAGSPVRSIDAGHRLTCSIVDTDNVSPGSRNQVRDIFGFSDHTVIPQGDHGVFPQDHIVTPGNQRSEGRASHDTSLNLTNENLGVSDRTEMWANSARYNTMKSPFAAARQCNNAVEFWLRGLDLPQADKYVQIFAEHDIDLTDLEFMSAAQLHDMGITSFSALDRILKGIRDLKIKVQGNVKVPASVNAEGKHSNEKRQSIDGEKGRSVNAEKRRSLDSKGRESLDGGARRQLDASLVAWTTVEEDDGGAVDTSLHMYSNMDTDQYNNGAIESIDRPDSRLSHVSTLSNVSGNLSERKSTIFSQHRNSMDTMLASDHSVYNVPQQRHSIDIVSDWNIRSPNRADDMDSHSVRSVNSARDGESDYNSLTFTASTRSSSAKCVEKKPPSASKSAKSAKTGGNGGKNSSKKSAQSSNVKQSNQSTKSASNQSKTNNGNQSMKNTGTQSKQASSQSKLRRSNSFNGSEKTSMAKVGQLSGGMSKPTKGVLLRPRSSSLTRESTGRTGTRPSSGADKRVVKGDDKTETRKVRARSRSAESVKRKALQGVEAAARKFEERSRPAHDPGNTRTGDNQHRDDQKKQRRDEMAARHLQRERFREVSAGQNSDTDDDRRQASGDMDHYSPSSRQAPSYTDDGLEGLVRVQTLATPTKSRRNKSPANSDNNKLTGNGDNYKSSLNGDNNKSSLNGDNKLTGNGDNKSTGSGDNISSVNGDWVRRSIRRIEQPRQPNIASVKPIQLTLQADAERAATYKVDKKTDTAERSDKDSMVHSETDSGYASRTYTQIEDRVTDIQHKIKRLKSLATCGDDMTLTLVRELQGQLQHFERQLVEREGRPGCKEDVNPAAVSERAVNTGHPEQADFNMSTLGDAGGLEPSRTYVDTVGGPLTREGVGTEGGLGPSKKEHQLTKQEHAKQFRQVHPEVVRYRRPDPVASMELEYTDISYKQTDVIGEGRYSRVYRGQYQGSEVAIKQLRRPLPVHDTNYFAAEVSLLKELRHPRVVLLIGVCTRDTLPVMVLELMSRGSLHDYLHNPQCEGLDHALYYQVARDVTQGMNYLHSHKPQVLHLDLKSMNILLCQSLRAKIADFGFSKLRQEAGSKGQGKGQAGLPQQRPCWTSPELLDKGEVTGKSDVYSFAVILWEMLTRETPYQGRSTFQILEMVRKNKRPEFPDTTPESLQHLISQCWNQNPAKRPQFKEILQLLENLAFPPAWRELFHKAGVPDSALHDVQSTRDIISLVTGSLENPAQSGPLHSFMVDHSHSRNGNQSQEQEVKAHSKSGSQLLNRKSSAMGTDKAMKKSQGANVLAKTSSSARSSKHNSKRSSDIDSKHGSSRQSTGRSSRRHHGAGSTSVSRTLTDVSWATVTTLDGEQSDQSTLSGERSEPGSSGEFRLTNIGHSSSEENSGDENNLLSDSSSDAEELTYIARSLNRGGGDATPAKRGKNVATTNHKKPVNVFIPNLELSLQSAREEFRAERRRISGEAEFDWTCVSLDDRSSYRGNKQGTSLGKDHGNQQGTSLTLDTIDNSDTVPDQEFTINGITNGNTSQQLDLQLNFSTDLEVTSPDHKLLSDTSQSDRPNTSQAAGSMRCSTPNNVLGSRPTSPTKSLPRSSTPTFSCKDLPTSSIAGNTLVDRRTSTPTFSTANSLVDRPCTPIGLHSSSKTPSRSSTPTAMLSTSMNPTLGTSITPTLGTSMNMNESARSRRRNKGRDIGLYSEEYMMRESCDNRRPPSVTSPKKRRSLTQKLLESSLTRSSTSLQASSDTDFDSFQASGNLDYDRIQASGNPDHTGEHELTGSGDGNQGQPKSTFTDNLATAVINRPEFTKKSSHNSQELMRMVHGIAKQAVDKVKKADNSEIVTNRQKLSENITMSADMLDNRSVTKSKVSVKNDVGSKLENKSCKEKADSGSAIQAARNRSVDGAIEDVVDAISDGDDTLELDDLDKSAQNSVIENNQADSIKDMVRADTFIGTNQPDALNGVKPQTKPSLTSARTSSIDDGWRSQQEAVRASSTAEAAENIRVVLKDMEAFLSTKHSDGTTKTSNSPKNPSNVAKKTSESANSRSNSGMETSDFIPKTTLNSGTKTKDFGTKTGSSSKSSSTSYCTASTSHINTLVTSQGQKASMENLATGQVDRKPEASSQVGMVTATKEDTIRVKLNMQDIERKQKPTITPRRSKMAAQSMDGRTVEREKGDNPIKSPSPLTTSSTATKQKADNSVKPSRSDNHQVLRQMPNIDIGMNSTATTEQRNGTANEILNETSYLATKQDETSYLATKQKSEASNITTRPQNGEARRKTPVPKKTTISVKLRKDPLAGRSGKAGPGSRTGNPVAAGESEADTGHRQPGCMSPIPPAPPPPPPILASSMSKSVSMVTKSVSMVTKPVGENVTNHVTSHSMADELKSRLAERHSVQEPLTRGGSKHAGQRQVNPRPRIQPTTPGGHGDMTLTPQPSSGLPSFMVQSMELKEQKDHLRSISRPHTQQLDDLDDASDQQLHSIADILKKAVMNRRLALGEDGDRSVSQSMESVATGWSIDTLGHE